MYAFEEKANGRKIVVIGLVYFLFVILERLEAFYYLVPFNLMPSTRKFRIRDSAHRRI